MLESPFTADAGEQAIAKAVSGKAATLTLVDEKGRKVIVATDKLAYVEIAETDQRRVGFAI